MEAQILKYIKGGLDTSEKMKILMWINDKEGNHKIFNILKAKYVASKLKDHPNDVSMSNMFLIK